MDEKKSIYENDEKVLLEEALERTGFGIYSFLLASVIGLVIIAYACIAYGATIIVAVSACELNTTEAQQGLIVAMPLIGTIFGALMWGYLGDTRGRRSMLIASLLSGALVNALASISVNWAMLMTLQMFAAFLSSGQYTLGMTLLSECIPQAKRNMLMLLVASIFLMSQGIMAVLAIPIIPLSYSYYLEGLDIFWNSWRTLLIVYSVPSLVCALCLFFMQESPKYHFEKRGDEEEALNVLRTIHGLNNKRGTVLRVKSLLKVEETQEKPKMKDQIVPLFKAPLLKYTILVSLLYILQQPASFAVWLPTIANQFVQLLETGEGGNLTMCGVIDLSITSPPPVDPNAVPCALNETSLLLVLAAGAIQSLVNGILSLVVHKTGRRNMVLGMVAVTSGAGLILNVVPNAIGSGILFLVFLTGMIGLGMYTAITVALFPTHLRAMAVALTMTGSRLARFALVQVLNVLLTINCEAAFYLFAGMFACSLIAAWLLPDDRLSAKKPKATEGTEL